MLEPLWQLITHDIAIDLGTANTLVAVRGYGVVIDEPSVVAVNTQNDQVLAVGAEAKHMIGRTPGSVRAVRPLREGVISDFDTAEAMMRYFVQQVTQSYGSVFKISKPRVVIGVPSLITEVESMAVVDAAKSAGARKVYIVEEAIAAAVGSGLAIEDAGASMVVDIGGGTTDIALISLGGVVSDSTIKVAGDAMDSAIAEYVRHKYNLLIGEKMAETAKMQIGTMQPSRTKQEFQISGRDLIQGLPKTIKISDVEVREALQPVCEQIATAAKKAIESAPPELMSDLLNKGVTLVGGGALLPALDKYLAGELKVPVQLGKNPSHAVVNGTYQLLDQIKLLERIQISQAGFR